MDKAFLGKDKFIWWKGVVEDRKDPIFLGRVRVRIFGWHTENKEELPTVDLPWAMISLPADNGRSPVGLKEGDWCWGFFLDGEEAQKPIVVGYIPGIDEDAADPEIGFYDPTPDEELVAGSVPRPPEMIPVNVVEVNTETGETVQKTGGRFGDPDKLPGQTVAFGQLTKDYSADSYKFDLNQDGVYDEKDSNQMLDLNNDGIPSNENEFFSGQVAIAGTSAISRYPLEDRLMEPSTSRLSRNENIEKTIVAFKQGDLGAGEGGGYDGSGVGGDSSADSAPFQEPATPYDAKYPYNHVYESESGHVIEVDDSPSKERMHWYHRSGTFTEIHPDGLEVNKIKKSQYNFIYEEFYNSTLKSINFDAGEAFRVKAGTVINHKAGSDINRQSGGNLNALVGGDKNTRVSGDENTVVEGGSKTHISDDTYVFIKEGVLHIMAARDIAIGSVAGSIQLTSPAEISLVAPKVTLEGASIHHVGTCIGSQLPAPAWGAPTPAIPLINEAFKDDWYDDDAKPSDGSTKYGFLLPRGVTGDVWKPISESDQKLVTLSAAGQEHELREALPTGRLEAVKIKYQHPSGEITEWEVVRPVHVVGKLIDTPNKIDQFEDGVRWLNRWDKAGKDYPKQLFWIVKGGPTNLILDSAERHQCTITYDDRVNFDLRTIKKEETDSNTSNNNNNAL